MERKPLKQVTVDIQEISSEGFGVGHHTLEDGSQRTVEVPFTLPGDQVRASILKKRRSEWSSRLDEVIHPSPLRQPALCAHFGTCGGCRWQHIPYSEQLAIKEQWLLRHFEPFLEELRSLRSYPANLPGNIEIRWSSLSPKIRKVNAI